MISCRMLCGVPEEEGREKHGWRREKWELRKPAVSAELKSGQKGLAERVGICVLLPEGRGRGQDGGTARRGLSVPVLPETAKVVMPPVQESSWAAQLKGPSRYGQWASAC